MRSGGRCPSPAWSAGLTSSWSDDVCLWASADRSAALRLEHRNGAGPLVLAGVDHRADGQGPVSALTLLPMDVPATKVAVGQRTDHRLDGRAARAPAGRHGCRDRGSAQRGLRAAGNGPRRHARSGRRGTPPHARGQRGAAKRGQVLGESADHRDGETNGRRADASAGPRARPIGTQMGGETNEAGATGERPPVPVGPLKPARLPTTASPHWSTWL